MAAVPVVDGGPGARGGVAEDDPYQMYMLRHPADRASSVVPQLPRQPEMAETRLRYRRIAPNARSGSIGSLGGHFPPRFQFPARSSLLESLTSDDEPSSFSVRRRRSGPRRRRRGSRRAISTALAAHIEPPPPIISLPSAISKEDIGDEDDFASVSSKASSSTPLSTSPATPSRTSPPLAALTRSVQPVRENLEHAVMCQEYEEEEEKEEEDDDDDDDEADDDDEEDGNDNDDVDDTCYRKGKGTAVVVEKRGNTDVKVEVNVVEASVTARHSTQDTSRSLGSVTNEGFRGWRRSTNVSTQVSLLLGGNARGKRSRRPKIWRKNPQDSEMVVMKNNEIDVLQGETKDVQAQYVCVTSEAKKEEHDYSNLHPDFAHSTIPAERDKELSVSFAHRPFGNEGNGRTLSAVHKLWRVLAFARTPFTRVSIRRKV